jgi:hypothetical protein
VLLVAFSWSLWLWIGAKPSQNDAGAVVFLFTSDATTGRLSARDDKRATSVYENLLDKVLYFIAVR